MAFSVSINQTGEELEVSAGGSSRGGWGWGNLGDYPIPPWDRF